MEKSVTTTPKEVAAKETAPTEPVKVPVAEVVKESEPITQVFVISTNAVGGEGYDGYDETLGFALNEEEARAAVDKLTESYNKAVDVTNKVNEIRIEYRNSHPEPQMEYVPTRKSWSKGVPQSAIPVAMRNERDRTNALIQSATAINSQRITEYNNATTEFVKEYVKTLDDDILQHFDDDLLSLRYYLVQDSPFIYKPVNRL